MTLPLIAYQPVTTVAARVARRIDAAPPSIDALCVVADALNAPVESFLIGTPDE